MMGLELLQFGLCWKRTRAVVVASRGGRRSTSRRRLSTSSPGYFSKREQNSARPVRLGTQEDPILVERHGSALNRSITGTGVMSSKPQWRS